MKIDILNINFKKISEQTKNENVLSSDDSPAQYSIDDYDQEGV